jgi:hypothetical protein
VTRYGLDDQDSISVSSGDFSLRHLFLDRQWGYILLFSQFVPGVLFPEGKATGACSSLFTSIK